MKDYLKKNKALFILPLALIPFLVLIFYILGGGDNANTGLTENTRSENQKGANYMLPEADKSIEIFDKMEAYQKQNEKLRIQTIDILGETDSVLATKNGNVMELDSAESNLIELARNSPDVSAKLLSHIKRRELEIKKELEPKAEPSLGEHSQKPATHQTLPRTRHVTQKHPVKPKEQSIVRTTGIEELDEVFEENNSLTRQNDSLKFYLQQAQQELSVLEEKKNAGFSVEKAKGTGFDKTEEKPALIKAEIYETTTVLDGNRVKLRLLDDVWVNQRIIAKNSFIYGTCQVKDERILISITQLPIDENFLPVELAVHDLDGLKGLYVPDNVARKVYKEVGPSTNTSSLFGMTDDPLTYAGIRAADRTAQTLLKRQRLKKVTLKKNTLVYIINQKS